MGKYIEIKNLSKRLKKIAHLFIDNEGTTLIVLGNFEEFQNKNDELSDKYYDEDLDYAGFYEELESMLKESSFTIVDADKIISNE